MKTRNKKTIIRLLMIFICAVSLQGMLGCGGTKTNDGSGGTDGSVNDNPSGGNTSSGSGISGKLDNETVSISPSDLIYAIKILEGGSSHDEILDESDVGFAVNAYKEVSDEDKESGDDYVEFYTSIAVMKYTDFQKNVTYTFQGDELTASINFETQDVRENYDIEKVKIKLTTVPGQVGDDVAGELTLTTESGDSLTIKFSGELDSQIISYL